MSVAGAAIVVRIAWAGVPYNVTFGEAGLPAGTTWWVNVTSGVSTEGTTSTLVESLTNGTYAFTLASGDYRYRPVPRSGTVNVSGSSQQVQVSFYQVRYPVVFNETGLPVAGWAVTFNGVTIGTTQPSDPFGAINGSYSFAVDVAPGYQPTPGSGTIQVAGAGVYLNITFTQVLYTAEFVESGLPAGTSWNVAVAGSNRTTTGTTTSMQLANGTYDFLVSPEPGYEAAPSQGTVVVNGSSLTEPIAFSPSTTAQFPLWFNETGLPSDTNWAVTVLGTGSFAGSTSNYSTTRTVTFEVPPGFTGSFAVNAPPGFTASPPSGSIDTPSDGSAQSLPITFSSTSGNNSPPGPTIQSFSAVPKTLSVGATLTLTVAVEGGEAPNSYTYAGLPDGCSSHNASTMTCTPALSGSFKVMVKVTDALDRAAVANVTVTVNPAGTTGTPTGNPSSPGPTFLGLPAAEGYVLAGSLLTIAVVVAVTAIWWRRRLGASPPEAADSRPE